MTQPNTQRRWLTAAEVAEMTGYSVRTVRLSANTGELKGEKRGAAPSPQAQWRFRPEAVEAWIEGAPPAAARRRRQVA